MIYTVTFNPSIDYITYVTDFTPHNVNRTKEEHIFPGGKGINVSMMLKNLNYETTALGFLAGFTGKQIQRDLEHRGITTDFLFLKEGLSRINVKISSNGMTEVNGQGPTIQASDLQNLYEQLDHLQPNDTLVLAGSIPGSIPQSIYRDIMARLSGRNIRIVVDATGDLLLRVLEYHPFLIKPNHHELGELFHVDLTKKEDTIPYAKQLQEMGARNVLISMGGAGAVLLTENGEIYLSEAPGGKPVNTVGAGDSMVAGFLAGYLNHNNYKEAFELSLCAGSASACSKFFATSEEIYALLPTCHSSLLQIK